MWWSNENNICGIWHEEKITVFPVADNGVTHFSFYHPMFFSSAKRYLLSEDVVKLQDFQQRKLAVAHLVTGAEGKEVLVILARAAVSCQNHLFYLFIYFWPNFAGNFIELFRQKMRRNELILRDELKLLLHLCQSTDDMLIAREAIYRYATC